MPTTKLAFRMKKMNKIGYTYRKNRDLLIFLVLLCGLGPLKVQFEMVDFSLQTIFVLLPIYFLGPKKSFWIVLIYLVLGFMGLPVFSGYMGGSEKFYGPTAGFLFSFLLVTLIPRKIVGPVFIDSLARQGIILLVGFGYLFIHTGAVKWQLIHPFIPWALVKSGIISVLFTWIQSSDFKRRLY